MSFQIGIKPKDIAAAKVVQQLQEAIVGAFLKRRRNAKLKQADIAKKLEVDRAQVSRWLNGPGDMTLKSIGYLLWAMDAKLKVDVELKDDVSRSQGCNQPPLAAPTAPAYSGNVSISAAGTYLLRNEVNQLSRCTTARVTADGVTMTYISMSGSLGHVIRKDCLIFTDLKRRIISPDLNGGVITPDTEKNLTPVPLSA